ncbi:MAG: nucleotidyl transferase AbiEii/AbiGii toxin family protein [Methylobacterium sp.]|nr:MAG: nucleotidyl transferase AbiEii/AbiGii toxin family protein [Methylobacterium sp.]
MSNDQPTTGDRKAARLRDVARNKKINTSAFALRVAQAGALRRIVAAMPERIVLKGGQLQIVAHGDAARPTADIDLHSRETSEAIGQALRAALATDAGDDIRFDVSRVENLAISEDDAGTRLHVVGWIGPIRSNFHLDIASAGPCDAVEWRPYPPLMKGDEPFEVPCQPWRSVAADKVHAVVEKGMSNTRVRDYLDLARLIPQLDTDEVAAEIVANFGGRGTALPAGPVDGLSPAFGAVAQVHWERWVERTGITGVPGVFAHLVAEVGPWIEDVLERARYLAPKTGRAFR